MAKYRTEADFFHNGVYYSATRANPLEFEISDKEIPSVKWTPLDDAAKKAMKAALDHQKAKRARTGPDDIVPVPEGFAAGPKPPEPSKANPTGLKVKDAEEEQKDHGVQRPKRASDRDF